jgi:adenine-specific DNA-methyltransferase
VNFMLNESADKLRGGYYTPSDLALFLARWIAQGRPEAVLEPSCGDGSFLEALAVGGCGPARVTALELNAIEAGKANARAQTLGIEANVLNQDFLGWALREMAEGGQRFDGVIGNPPFVRYQYLPPNFQGLAERIFSTLGCRFTKHTNAWVPFVLASMALLRPGGRLAMVVPSEIIHVLHAQSLRTFLGETCRKLVIVDPEEIWFEDTLQGAVLLMAEKKRAPDVHSEGLGLVQVRGRDFLNKDPADLFTGAVAINGRTVVGKWTRAFLDVGVRRLLDELEEIPAVHRFREIADVDVGIVTGANKFFLVSDETVETYGLGEWAHPMFGRSEHCPGVVYDAKQHKANGKAGLPSNFLWFPDAAAGRHPKVAAYVRMGEKQQLHTRYKCRIRKPWFTVPSVHSTEIGMLKRSHNAPRLILNKAGAYTTDTAYRIQSHGIRTATLVGAFVNPLTALSAELEGRTYGGGVLELVPSEIERLLVPVPRDAAVDVRALDRAVRTSPMQDILAGYGCDILKAIGVSKAQCGTLVGAWAQLKNRRQRVAVTEDDAE